MGAPEELVETSLGELRVTRALLEEAGDVLRLREDLAQWMVERGIEQWRPGELPPERIETSIAEGRVYVGRFHEAVVASVTVVWEDPFVWGESKDPAGYIHMLMVDRAVGGREIGRALLSWAEEHIRRSGRALVRLDCVRSNRPLRAYYERAGYRLVGYQDFPEVEWVLETALYEKSVGRS